MIRTPLRRRSSRLSSSGPLRKGSIFERRVRVKRTTEDDLFSKYIRLRDPVCRYRFRCLGARSVEASHVFGRVKMSVRFDESNAFGACWACHDWADHHDTEKKDWARKTLGDEGFNRLQVRAQLTGTQVGLDLRAIRKHYREKIKQLETRG